MPALNELAGSIASAWYNDPSDGMLAIGVTGTNGKTSCSQWISAALTALGKRCAIIGTLGTGLPGQLVHTGFTTPDAPQLQRSLAQLRDAGAQAVAMEVSSHALHQGRVNGTAFDIAVFTNLTQDHLDYHGTFEAYEAAKARLFAWPELRAAVDQSRRCRWSPFARLHAGPRPHDRLRPRREVKDASDADAPQADALLLAIERARDGDRYRVSPGHIRLGQRRSRSRKRSAHSTSAICSAYSARCSPPTCRSTRRSRELAKLEPVNGRMQRLGGRLQNDEPLVVIDYAHTPDALEKTLEALRPMAAARGGELICMFGCGGDRDATKRPLMGAIAEKLADGVVVTSDNPRSEDPQSIIEQIAAGMKDASKARRIEDRASAILQAIRSAAREDVIVLAGKGHEATQEIMGKKRAFSDQDHARLALAARATHARGGGE